jgi:hypothetical protein
MASTTPSSHLRIILAAPFVCLSLCFASAEVPSVTAEAAGSQGSSIHADFLAPLQEQLLPPTASVHSQQADPPVISMQVVNQLTGSARHSRGFWHRISLTRQQTGLVIRHPLSNSGVDATDAPATEMIQGAESTLNNLSDQTE